MTTKHTVDNVWKIIDEYLDSVVKENESIVSGKSSCKNDLVVISYSAIAKNKLIQHSYFNLNMSLLVDIEKSTIINIISDIVTICRDNAC